MPQGRPAKVLPLSIPLWCDWDRPGATTRSVSWPTFNPTVVRLGLAERLADRLCWVPFNPTVVRLGPAACRYRQAAGVPFNPTVVRLGHA